MAGVGKLDRNNQHVAFDRNMLELIILKPTEKVELAQATPIAPGPVHDRIVRATGC